MKINFVIPFTNKTGGTKIIFEYANRLKECGHDVVLYVPVIAYKYSVKGIYGLSRRMKATLGNIIKRRNKVNWFNLKVTVKLVPIIKNNYIRNADVIIATAWPTAYDVHNLNDFKGTKFYFIQHYEVWSGEKEDVDRTYLLPLKQIVIAKWLKELMRDQFKNEYSDIVYNGIDFNEFNNKSKIFNNKTICMLYHSLDWKGYRDGLAAFNKVKSKIPDLKLVLFGMERGQDIPEGVQFHLNPSREELVRIYCDSDVFIFPSKTEGWGLTPLEAMACKCAVIGTNVGALKEIGVNRINALISESGDIETLSENLYKILNDTNLLKSISINGYSTVLNFSWDKSVQQFEKILINSICKDNYIK